MTITCTEDCYTVQLAKELNETRLTVRIVAMFLEGAFIEQLETEGTCEVLRMPLLTHCGDALAYK